MKKHIYLILLAVIAVASCDINKSPLSQLSPDSFFSTRAELDAFANTFYADLPSTDVYRENSDMCIHLSMASEYNGTRVVPASGGGWSFSALRNYNTLIEYSVNCEDVNVRNEYQGVARFFRAFFYLEKVKRFGDVPWYDRQLGSSDPDLYKPRDSRELVMSNVVEDLDFAIKYLPTDRNTYKVTKWTALALKSRACLFEGTFRKYHNVDLPGHDADWYLQQAADAAEEFILTSGYGIYNGGGPKNSYNELFASTDAISSEIILARDYDQALKVLHNGTYNYLGNYGNPGMTRKMFCSYLMKDGSRYTDKEGWETEDFVKSCSNRDPRLSQSIRTEGYTRIGGDKTLAPDFGHAVTGYHITKYCQGVDLNVDLYGASFNDLPVFRTAEVLLNYAEAKAELGTLVQADLDKSIKLLRDRVGMPGLDMDAANASPDPYLMAAATGYPNVSGKNAGVILEIRRERAIELFDENFRYYDNVRWKNGQAYNHPHYGMYIPGPGTYDLNADGKDDVCFWNGSAPNVASGVLKLEIGKDVVLSDGDHGCVYVNHNDPGKWDEERDYFYPIPTNEISLTDNALKQNPGWNK